MANITLNIHDNANGNTSKVPGVKQGAKQGAKQPKPPGPSDSATKEEPKDGKVSF